MDPTTNAPQLGYRPASPHFKEPPIACIQRMNVAPALGPTPLNQPNSLNPNPFAGFATMQQPHNDKELQINLSQPFNGDRKKWRTFQNAIVLYLGINRHIDTSTTTMRRR